MKHLKKSLLTVLTVFTLFMVGTHGMEAKALAPAPPESCFSISSLSSSLTTAYFSVEYGSDRVEVSLCDANLNQLQTTTCYASASFTGLKKNKLYYYRIRGLMYSNGTYTPVTEWSAYKAFATPKPKIKLTSKKSKTVSIKIPKIAGVKKYNVFLSTKKDKGYKKIKSIKPGKTFKISKFKGKAFKFYANYYYRISPVLKKAATTAPLTGYFLLRRYYF